jgi:tRNA threonylcarbamoyl adenosine modification protein YeaZ
VSGRLLAIDTATNAAVVAVGAGDGSLLAAETWIAGYRHGEELLSRVDRVLAASQTRLADLTGIVVGTGPGAFTGLRVGLATAKGLAHGLGIVLVGLPTGAALRAAAAAAGVAGPVAVLLPAGPSDRVLIDPTGIATLVRAGTEPILEPGWTAIALDLDGRAPADAVARGALARDGLAAALLALGAERLREGQPSDLAELVPEYVTLPRGVRAETGTVGWSRDPA